MVAVAALTVSGCAAYNGSIRWPLSGDDEQTLIDAAYRAGVSGEQAEASVRSTGSERAIIARSPGGGAGASAPTASPDSPRAQPAPVSPAIPADPGVRMVAAGRPAGLSLYGELPRVAAPRGATGGGALNLQRLTFSSEGSDFDPAVDPTGRLLLYASTRHRETADIYVKQIGGSTVTQLTSDPANDVMPAFSPDGRYVAFASDRSGNWDIYLMEADGGKAVQLTSDPADELHPSFSPDGQRLVFSSFGAQSAQWELVVMDLDPRLPRTRRFLGYGLFPEWSPVDDVIVYQRPRERGTRWFSIWTVQLVEGEAVRPTEIAASSNAAAITPRWSSDGRHIVFTTVIQPDAVSDGEPARADVWMVRADGAGRVNLTNSPFADLQPVWAPDGAVLFVSNRAADGVENIWSLRSEQATRVAGGMPDSGAVRTAGVETGGSETAGPGDP